MISKNRHGNNNNNNDNNNNNNKANSSHNVIINWLVYFLNSVCVFIPSPVRVGTLLMEVPGMNKHNNNNDNNNNNNNNNNNVNNISFINDQILT